MCDSDVQVLTKADARFSRVVNNLLTKKRVTSACRHGVDPDYVQYVKDRISVVMWINDSSACELKRRAQTVSVCATCGFALGYWYGSRKATFYIDLICTAHKQGSVLMHAMEEYGRAHGATHSALRAATKELVGVYERKYQYRRVANACLPPDEKKLKRLDKNAEETIVVDDEVIRRARDGYWMSKCLKVLEDLKDPRPSKPIRKPIRKPRTHRMITRSIKT